MTRPQIELTDALLDVDFWRELAPNFTIEKKIGSCAIQLRDEQKKKQNEKIVREGYIHLANPGLNASFEKIADVFAKIFSLGLPPVFFFVYDELWMLNRQLSHLLASLLHEEYAMLPAFWAWHVLPGQAGWKPHRDMTAENLFPDRKPKSLTVWLPITKAYPLNSCMYVLPADRDPGYGIENPPEGSFAWPDIRALPAEPGDVLAWTHHLLHWGGRSADLHDLPPRMSAAFEYQRLDVRALNTPLLDPAVIPNFKERLSLISKQVMQYRHMYNFHEDLVNLAWKISLHCQLPKGLESARKTPC